MVLLYVVINWRACMLLLALDARPHTYLVVRISSRISDFVMRCIIRQGLSCDGTARGIYKYDKIMTHSPDWDLPLKIQQVIPVLTST